MKSYKIREYLGKYEAYLLVMRGRKALGVHDFYIEVFLKHFPKAIKLTDIKLPDVHWYKKLRAGDGATIGRIRWELFCMQRFYNYCIDVKGVPISNPFNYYVDKNDPQNILRRKNDVLRLNDFERLLYGCNQRDPILAKWLIRLMAGHDVEVHIPEDEGWRRLAVVARNMNMPFATRARIKRSLKKGLWRNIIYKWANLFLTHTTDEELSNSLPEEPEPTSNPLTTVQVPALDEWPSISDPSEYCATVSRVPDEQEGIEG
jgi:hypothetical protein